MKILILTLILISTNLFSQKFFNSKKEVKGLVKLELISESENSLKYYDEKTGLEKSYFFNENDELYINSLKYITSSTQLNAHDLLEVYQKRYKDIRESHPKAPVNNNSFIADFCDNNYEKCLTLDNARKESIFFYTDPNRNILKHTIKVEPSSSLYLVFEETLELTEKED